jgi:hypothetical protein
VFLQQQLPEFVTDLISALTDLNGNKLSRHTKMNHEKSDHCD